MDNQQLRGWIKMTIKNFQNKLKIISYKDDITRSLNNILKFND